MKLEKRSAGDRVTCFGVGDGAACGDRNHSSYLYQLGEATVLIDCGEPISRSFKASGLPADSVDRIILSHLHFDHVGGLFMLLQGFWLEGRSRKLTIHLPAEGCEPIRSMMRAGYLFDELLGFELAFVPLAAGETFEVNGVRVTPHATSHLDGLRDSFQERYGGAFEAYSFVLETPDLRVVHSADLGAPEDLEPLLAQRADWLLCELAHFEPEEIGRYLRGKPVGRVAFIHLGRAYWEAFEATRSTVTSLLPESEVVFPRDLQELTLA